MSVQGKAIENMFISQIEVLWEMQIIYGLQIIMIMLAFSMNEVRKNGRFGLEREYDPTYLGYGVESRPKGEWQECR